MNRLLLYILITSCISACAASKSERIVILHTNDTHSQIDPLDNGEGGLLRRKVIIDSIRDAEPNVLLIDAGDVVQGTMYYTLYKGEVEYSTLDMLGYDIAILGNHDFDNKVEQLSKNISKSKVTWLSANYDFSGAPGLDSVFVPAVIKEFSNKKIGILGINLDPKGMIAEGHYDGVTYRDGKTVADSVAHDLKKNHEADYVIAVTHIGYDGNILPNDASLASDSKYIDLIIGGHSHTLLDPEKQNDRFYWKHINSNGDTVAIVQAGSKGAYIGKTVINLDNNDI
ncbi:MAG: metallophosphatase, partial [Muribaculaceae bacterium]|nr:metallophosphatase [Muribaculaceae bacterium]